MVKTHGFVYKKPTGRPFKSDEKQQNAFIKEYNDLKNNLKNDEIILFGDSAHPTQSTRIAYGWILKGQDHCIPTTKRPG